MKLTHSIYILIGILILSLIPNVIYTLELLSFFEYQGSYYSFKIPQTLENIFFLLTIILSILFFIQLLRKILYHNKKNININVLSIITSSFYLLLIILSIFSLIKIIKFVNESNRIWLYLNLQTTPTSFMFLEFFSNFFIYSALFIFFFNLGKNIINKKILSFTSIIAISFSIVAYLVFVIILFNMYSDYYNYFRYTAILFNHIYLLSKFVNKLVFIFRPILYLAYLNFFLSLYKLQKKEV